MNKKHLAFSLIELSIVVLIIGILIAGVTQGSRLVRQSKLATANSLTTSSPVASISGLIVWLDTVRPNSLQNANSEFEVQDRDSIENWYSVNPQMTDSIVANQATSVNQPTYVASGINGLPSISFNGTNNHLAIPDSDTISPTTGITLFAVVQFSTFTPFANGVMGIISKDISGGITYPAYYLEAVDATNVRFGITKADNGGQSASVSGSGITMQINNPYVFYGSFNSATGTKIGFNLNSTVYTGATPGAMADTNVPLRIGQQKSGSNRFFGGYISEIIIYNRLLKNSEIKDINKYLTQKYGITFA
jgi:prepilin-type N-terminal cleavage/methylation domain-containing protein